MGYGRYVSGEPPQKLPKSCVASLSQIVALVGGDKGDLSRLFEDLPFTKAGKAHLYPLDRALRMHADWLRNRGDEDGKTAMDAKLEEDKLYTRMKRLRDSGELVALADAERVAATMAATVSNAVDSWGLHKVRRNELMDMLKDAIGKAWDSEEVEDEDE